VDQQILSHGRRCFLVDQGNREAGLLTLHNLKEVPRSSWTTTTAAQAMTPIEKLSRIDVNAELWTALEKMGRDGINQMPVMRGNELVGMLSRSDVVRVRGRNVPAAKRTPGITSPGQIDSHL